MGGQDKTKKMNCALDLILVYFGFFTPVNPIGLELQCPGLFQNGENIVTCKINKTAITQARCLSMYKSVTFEWVLNSKKRVACSSSAYDPEAKCMSGNQHSPGSCWCEESSGEIFTYKFSYLANSTYDRGKQLECNFCVLPLKSLDISIAKECKNISFVSHQESQTNSPFWIGKVTGVCFLLIFLLFGSISLMIAARKNGWHLCKALHKSKKDHGRSHEVDSGEQMLSSTDEPGYKPEQNGRTKC